VQELSDWLDREAVTLENPDGRGPFVLVCDHASNWVPTSLKGLGLPDTELERHIAWDPGALEFARRLSELLDAPLVHAAVSRLVLDVNRDPGHPGSIVTRSEDTDIPGNQGISAEERARRVQSIYEPYHRTLDAVIEKSVARNQSPQIISVHSFTPVYRKEQRPWHIGILHADDERLSQPLLELLRADGEFCVGDNQPYAPTDGVYHTLDRHCSVSSPRPESHSSTASGSAVGSHSGAASISSVGPDDHANLSLRSVLLELRSDTISSEDGREQWALRLERALRAIH
jgi:predicted N-formylglutamate amidohydrolase